MKRCSTSWMAGRCKLKQSFFFTIRLAKVKRAISVMFLAQSVRTFGNNINNKQVHCLNMTRNMEVVWFYDLLTKRLNNGTAYFQIRVMWISEHPYLRHYYLTLWYFFSNVCLLFLVRKTLGFVIRDLNSMKTRVKKPVCPNWIIQ